MDWIELARQIATKAHRGQVDKGGNPYINHPATVALMMKTDNEKVVAWLHDVVEDTMITLQDLKTYRFSDVIVEAVDV